MATKTSPNSVKDVDIEKPQNVHCEYAALGGEDAEFMRGFSEQERRKLVRKIDFRLVPVLCILYLVSFIDRANIGNAKIEGLMEDLNLTGEQYNAAVSVFFAPYVILDIPSNVVLKKFKRPSLWMSILLVSFGTCMTMHGVTKNYAGLLVARIFMGVAEAGFFPGAIYIISTWYAPNEVGSRMSLFAVTSTMSGAFSGLLAFAIANMKGIGGYNGWRWIFIIEGLATVTFGLVCPFILADTPELSSRWLTEREIRYLNLRQALQFGGRNLQEKAEKFQWKTLLSVLTDWKIYIMILIYWSNTAPNFAMKITMPTIMKTMGYTSSNAQLMTIPPYFIGSCAAYITCLLADRYKWRMPFILGPQVCILVAFSILFPYAADIENHIPACYFAVILACIGFAPITPGANAWTSNNVAGPMRRAMGLAFMMGFGNIGGLIGSNIYLEKESPRYSTGYGTSLAFGCLGVICSISLELILLRLNKKKASMTEEEVREKYTDDELAKMGDKSPLYKYTL